MKKNNRIHIYYLLLGIGIGLALGGTMFFLSPNVKYIGYTEDEIREKARVLGMYELDEIFEMNNKFNEQIQKNLEMKNENVQDNNTEVGEDVKEASTEKVVEDKQKERDKIEENTDSSNSQSEEYIKFIIKEGESSEKVINNLFEEKIIEDKEQFRKLVYGRKVDRKLRYGIFMIPKGANNDTIIDILIK